MGARSGFFLALENRECDFGLGLRMNHRPDEAGGYGGAGAGFGGPWNSGGYVVGGGGGAMAAPRSRQDPSGALPFNVSGGGDMAGVSSGYAFTVAQREELHRQSAIYKYMVASVPVPPELLVPKSISHRSKVGRGSVEVGLWSNKDPEPWRCRRTDGKKWRCNRDAAPEQRYCERHTHKSRNSRSRKPVELNSSKPYQKPCSVLVNQRQSQRGREDQLWSFPSSYDHQSRCLDWFINGETINAPQQHGFGHDQQHTRLFIDAWSAAERDGDVNHHKSSVSSSVSSNPKLPFSCLTLSTSGGDLDYKEESSGELKPSWMSPVSWMNSPPGGPLAEALCLGIAGSGCSSSSAGKSSFGDGGQGLNFIN